MIILRVIEFSAGLVAFSTTTGARSVVFKTYGCVAHLRVAHLCVGVTLSGKLKPLEFK